ncbi:Potassium-transporting ATPase A subunit [Oscillibacter sp. PC13]|nr:Potassium-transporting ATPase A subunit [Oscillibacter sp. PC13]
MLEPIAVTETVDGYELLPDAKVDLDDGVVTVDGEAIPDAVIVTEQYLPLYPQASQVPPKQAGTNGGGILGANSAYPFENPSAASNLIEMTLILLIPVALCFSFGKMVKERKQGIAIFLAIFMMLVVALGGIVIPFIAIKAIDLIVATAGGL